MDLTRISKETEDRLTWGLVRARGTQMSYICCSLIISEMAIRLIMFKSLADGSKLEQIRILI